MKLPKFIKNLFRAMSPITPDDVLAAFMAEPSLTPDDLRFDTEYVVGFAFDTDLRYVSLIRKNKEGWQKGLMNGLGGHVDEGETPERAMVREFLEEGDVATNADQWIYFLDMIGSKDPAKPGESKSYRVRCYCAVLAESPKEREIEEGLIVRFPVRAVFPGRSDMLDNVPFTVALAHSTLVSGNPIHTTAVY